MNFNFLFHVIKDFLPICISIVALFISWKTYKRITIPLDSYCSPISTPLNLLLIDDDEMRSITNTNLNLINLTVINPSEIDLDCFSLRVFDETNNKELNIYNQEMLKYQLTDGFPVTKAVDYEGNIIPLKLFETADYFHTFKSHSITNLSIVINPALNTEECFIVYKIARHVPWYKKINQKYGYKKSKYETHRHRVKLPLTNNGNIDSNKETKK